MTVIRPNSITGITSITALANEINVFRHNGVLAGLQLNGVNHHTSAGVSTFHTVNVLGNLDVAGVLTYQDVTNVDSLGIGTFRTGINVSGGQLDVGSSIKLGNAGVITATSFVGSGANLTGISDVSIANQSDNRLITCTGTTDSLNGEQYLTYTSQSSLNLTDGVGTSNLGGNYLLLKRTNGTTNYINAPLADANLVISADENLLFHTVHTADYNSTERARITSDGRLIIGRNASRMVGGSTTYAKLQVAGTSQSESSISLVNNENDPKGPFVFFGKTRGNSVGESGIVQDGDTLGGLSFIGADGNDTNNRTAEITAVVNGSPANNTIPTDLVFSTSTQNATQLTERLRISSTGNVGIKLDNPQEPLNVKGTISTGRNLAREVGTIINISSDYNSTRGAANVINGSKNYEDYANNDWITANGARVNANFTLDLGAQYTCDRLVIYNQNEYSNNVREVKRFTFEGSNDNSSWTTLLDTECGASYAHEPNPGFSFRLPSDYIDDNEGVTYRYWRFTMKNFHGSTTLGGIMELELYEHATGEHSDDETTSEITSHAVMASEIYAQNIYHDSPCFYVAKSGSQSTSNQTWTIIQLTDNNSGGFDTSGYWDNSNYRFNPKIPGYYQFNFNLSISHGSLQASYIAIYKNGSVFTQTGRYFLSGDNYDDATMNTSAVIHLDGQSDYVDFRGWRLGGSQNMGGSSAFCQASGFLVRHAGYLRHGHGV